MKLQMKTITIALGTLSAAIFIETAALADSSMASVSSTNNPPAAPNTRYGFFDGLDHRSSYGQGVFPEPFLVDDSDSETREFRLDWLHTANGGDHTDIVHPELEWGFGNLTLELEAPYERDVEDGVVTKGFDNVDVGARYPLYEAVSPGGFADTTFGTAVEVGIPTTSDVSQNTELVPKIFNDTKLGNFTAQSIAGYSMLYGPGEDGGLNTFEYGFTFGYNITHRALALPDVETLIPVFELTGETELNHDHQTSLTGDAGLRANLKTIWGVQPRPGVVFVFPLNNNSRNQQDWGIMISLVFEF